MVAVTVRAGDRRRVYGDWRYSYTVRKRTGDGDSAFETDRRAQWLAHPIAAVNRYRDNIIDVDPALA